MAEPDDRPLIHLLVGLPGAGKTTLARRIESEQGAVRFTLDEWMLRLFDLTPDDAEYGARAERVKDLIWDIAGQFVHTGHDVVLDWSQWSRERRREAHSRAASLGARAALHSIETPLELAIERLRQRNARCPPDAHLLDIEEVRRFATQVFEPPSHDEDLPLAVESD